MIQRRHLIHAFRMIRRAVSLMAAATSLVAWFIHHCWQHVTRPSSDHTCTHSHVTSINRCLLSCTSESRYSPVISALDLLD